MLPDLQNYTKETLSALLIYSWAGGAIVIGWLAASLRACQKSTTLYLKTAADAMKVLTEALKEAMKSKGDPKDDLDTEAYILLCVP